MHTVSSAPCSSVCLLLCAHTLSLWLAVNRKRSRRSVDRWCEATAELPQLSPPLAQFRDGQRQNTGALSLSRCLYYRVRTGVLECSPTLQGHFLSRLAAAAAAGFASGLDSTVRLANGPPPPTQTAAVIGGARNWGSPRLPYGWAVAATTTDSASAHSPPDSFCQLISQPADELPLPHNSSAQL